MNLSFDVAARASGSRARAARLKTLHAEIETPVFMPVGTHAGVRGQGMEGLDTLGYRILLANTYHLLLRPGPEFFSKHGGIRPFSRWPHSFLTDSGGFQIFSLPHSRKMTEEGAEFRSYVDGQIITLTPELSIGTQRAIGSDIMMVLDECIPSTAPREEARRAMELTHRWAVRSLNARGDSPQALFGIVQGACFADLRVESAQAITSLPFDGFAIGGLAVGEGKDEREAATGWVTSLLPEDKPRYLMGVGTPIDLLEAVHRGVDMFDCILPTALGQQGVAFVHNGKIDLRKGIYREDFSSLDDRCQCGTCRTYSRAYLHQLLKVHDALAWSLVGAHNLAFYAKLMEEIRCAIRNDTFLDYYERRRRELGSVDDLPEMALPGRRDPVKRGAYEVVTRTMKGGDGQDERVASVKHSQSGEVMHSSENPVRESSRLYIEQSFLKEKLERGESVVIWDVGLGAATNAMGVVHLVEEVYRGAGGHIAGKLTLESFEYDLDPLELALSVEGSFEHLNHPAPKILIGKGAYSASGISWRLFKGDFTEMMVRAQTPHLIFYDPFSYKVDSALWTYAAFERLFARCDDSILFTYSASTAVRAALLAAGFLVASGASTGMKRETTIALTPRAAEREFRYELLGERWLTRWRNSHAKFPSDVKERDIPNFVSRIEHHPQFRGLMSDSTGP